MFPRVHNNYALISDPPRFRVFIYTTKHRRARHLWPAGAIKKTANAEIRLLFALALTWGRGQAPPPCSCRSASRPRPLTAHNNH